MSGGQRSSPIQFWPDARARSPSLRVMGSLEHPPALIGFGRLPFLEWRAVGHYPLVARPADGGVTTALACASASCTRDRPAGPNQSAGRKALRARPASHVTRPARPAMTSPRRHRSALIKASGGPGVFGRAPLLRFASPATLTGSRSRCPGRPASGRSRFGVSSASARARVMRPAGRMFSFALAVLRSSGIVAMKLAWRTRFGRSVPIESVARASAFAVAAGRRSIAPSVRLRSPAQVGPVKPVVGVSASCIGPKPTFEMRNAYHARRQPEPLERLRNKSAARSHGSFAKSRLLRVAFRYPFELMRGLVGRRRSSLLCSSPPDGAHGV